MNLITDRTQQDVLLETPKGQYGPEDLNRVENAVAALAQNKKIFGDAFRLETKTDWERTSVFSPDKWPTQSQMERYLNNVYRLCEALEMQVVLPVTMQRLTWEGANQIEQALLQAQTRIEVVLQTLRYSGEIFAGEENYL